MRQVSRNARFGSPGPRSGSRRGKTVATRLRRPSILIVCEGERTEPDYFTSFGVAAKVIGFGMSTLKLVEEAESHNRKYGPFDEIWCVFDRDSFPPADVDNALNKLASLSANGFHAAFSNESFELWYVLHFEYLQSALTRNDYCDKLDVYLGKYKKGDADNYDLMQQHGSESDAIRNAEKLLSLHTEGTPPSQCCPMTTVHVLVQRLRKIKRDSGGA